MHVEGGDQAVLLQHGEGHGQQPQGKSQVLFRGGEIAEVIVFLGANKSSYITGQTLAVDGGFEATGVGLPALRSES